MVFCCLALRAGRTRFGCRLLAGEHPLAPTPVVGRVDQRSAHPTHHLRAEEVGPALDRASRQPSNQGSRGSATSRPGWKISPTGMAHPGNPFGAT
jgi:hypothetical protein